MITLEEVEKKIKKRNGKYSSLLCQLWENAEQALCQKSEKGKSIVAGMNLQEVERAEQKMLDDINKANEALAEIRSVKELYESLIKKGEE